MYSLQGDISGCTSKRANHFHQSKHGLDVDEVVAPPLFVLYKLRSKSIVGIN